MRAILFILTLGICGLVAAQDPADAAAESEAATPDAAAAEQLPEAQPEEEPLPEAESGENALPEAIPDELLAGPGALVEEDPAVEASAEEEFNPDEEISEDYPVPLPSDI